MNKKIYLLITIPVFFVCCHNQKKDYTIGLNGKYFFSEISNLNYYIPDNFKNAYISSEIEYDSLLNTINNQTIKESVEYFYYYDDIYVHPQSLSSEYFFKEDSTNYTFIVLNEHKHVRLNDKRMEYFKDYRNSSLYKNTEYSTMTIDLTDDKFINRSNYQVMISRGKTKIKNDSVFWEYYIVSKFLKTFTIFTKSNQEFNFLPYIKAIEYGDKKINNE